MIFQRERLGQNVYIVILSFFELLQVRVCQRLPEESPVMMASPTNLKRPKKTHGSEVEQVASLAQRNRSGVG
jgi:hypothetical protein